MCGWSTGKKRTPITGHQQQLERPIIPRSSSNPEPRRGRSPWSYRQAGQSSEEHIDEVSRCILKFRWHWTSSYPISTTSCRADVSIYSARSLRRRCATSFRDTGIQRSPSRWVCLCLPWALVSGWLTDWLTDFLSNLCRALPIAAWRPAIPSILCWSGLPRRAEYRSATSSRTCPVSCQCGWIPGRFHFALGRRERLR